MTARETKASKGDPNREKRLAAALRANLAKRKARAQAVVSEDEEQARARGAKEGTDG